MRAILSERRGCAAGPEKGGRSRSRRENRGEGEGRPRGAGRPRRTPAPQVGGMGPGGALTARRAPAHSFVRELSASLKRLAGGLPAPLRPARRAAISRADARWEEGHGALQENVCALERGRLQAAPCGASLVAPRGDSAARIVAMRAARNRCRDPHLLSNCPFTPDRTDATS